MDAIFFSDWQSSIWLLFNAGITIYLPKPNHCFVAKGCMYFSGNFFICNCQRPKNVIRILQFGNCVTFVTF